MTEITAEYVRERLDYDDERGALIWRPKPGTTRHERSWNTRNAGKVAGNRKVPEGYFEIGIGYKVYLLHRIVWLHQKGSLPRGEIDHRDLDKGNNRINNLRDATPSQNRVNVRRRLPSTGVRGAYAWRGGGFVAKISIKNRQVHLGYFKTVEEARAAYAARLRDLHGEFAEDGLRLG